MQLLVKRSSTKSARFFQRLLIVQSLLVAATFDVTPVHRLHAIRRPIAQIRYHSSVLTRALRVYRPCTISNCKSQDRFICPWGKRVLGQDQSRTMECDSTLDEKLRGSVDRPGGKGAPR